jgi:Glycosyl hydrolases family 43.
MKINKIIFAVFIMLLSIQSYAQDFDVAKWIQPVPTTAKFGLKDYMVWCGSMVKGDDGKYYLFYSRWPRASGHYAWATESEVAIAVSDYPTGPYKHVKVALPKRDKKYWDADVTHNPTVYKFGKKYYLYYMGTRGTEKFSKQVTMKDAGWWEYRNNQRIGVAVANSPLGPWKRPDKPTIDTTMHSFDHQLVSNPAVTKRPDGKILMVYKGVSEGKMPFGGVVYHGAAIADKPEGPFKKLANRIFVKDSVKFAAEDPFIWYQQGKYWAIVKDFKGSFTNAGLSLALFESKDGLDWKPANNVLVTTTQIPWITGHKKVTRLERPQLWIDKGVPKVLFCAVYDGEDNYNVAIPLKMNN